MDDWDNDDMMMGMLMMMRIMTNEARNGQRIALEHVSKRVLESSIRYARDFIIRCQLDIMRKALMYLTFVFGARKSSIP